MTSCLKWAATIITFTSSKVESMRRENRDCHEFKSLLLEIEDAPLNPLGRTIFWIVVSTLVFTTLWLCFGKVDVVVSARGKVIPSGEVKTIQPLTTGVVRRILVRVGQLVEKGEILMEIDPAETEPELASMKAGLRQAELEILRLEALVEDRTFTPSPAAYEPGQLQVQQRLFKASREKWLRELRVTKEKLVQIDQRLAGEQKSYDQIFFQLEVSRQRQDRLNAVRDLISKDQYDQVRTDVEVYRGKLSSSLHKLEELRSSKAEIQEKLLLKRAARRNELLADLARKREESLYLKAKIERTEFVNTRQRIRSPVRGYVSQLFVHTIGGVVTPGENLAVMVPANSPSLIKAEIKTKDVGFLSPGMETAIKVDAFEFQKYGMLPGRLVQIGRDSVEAEHKGLVYEAYVEPLEKVLKINGVETPLATGMTVTTEIKVGRRRIIEFFVYPIIKYLGEGTSVR